MERTIFVDLDETVLYQRALSMHPAFDELMHKRNTMLGLVTLDNAPLQAMLDALGKGDKIIQSGKHRFIARPRPGAFEFLAELRKMAGVQALTMGITWHQNLVLAALGMDRCFDAVYGRDEFLNVPPQGKCILVDNMPYDDDFSIEKMVSIGILARRPVPGTLLPDHAKACYVEAPPYEGLDGVAPLSSLLAEIAQKISS